MQGEFFLKINKHADQNNLGEFFLKINKRADQNKTAVQEKIDVQGGKFSQNQ